MATPPQHVFVSAVLAKLDISKTALGSRVHRENGYNAVRDWETERVDLHYPEMMRMLELCGWLTPDALKYLQDAQTAAAQAASDAGQLLQPPQDDSEPGA